MSELKRWVEVPYFAVDAEPVPPEEDVPPEWRFRSGQAALLTDDRSHHWPATVLSDEDGWIVTVAVGIPPVKMSVPRQRVISDAMREAVDHLIDAVDQARKQLRQELSPEEHDRIRQGIMAAMIGAIEAHGGVVPEDSWLAGNIGWADATLFELERRRPKRVKRAEKARQLQQSQVDPEARQLTFEI